VPKVRFESNLPIPGREREGLESALPRRWLIRPEGPESTLWRTFIADLRDKVAAKLTTMLTSRDVVRRIAAHCAPSPTAAHSASGRME
jgi:hypothetical protein